MPHKSRPFSRRDFMKLSGEAALSASVAHLLYSENAFAGFKILQNERLFSVLQGVTTETQTQLTVDVPKALLVSFRLVGSGSGEVISPETLKVSDFIGEEFEVHHIQFSGLDKNEKYYFHVLDSEMNILDERELRTLDLNNPEPRIAFISCTRDNHKNKEMWEGVRRSRPDLIVMMGDNIYGDLDVEPNPRNLWRRFIEGRQKIHFYQQRKLVPVIATWDDHDYGKNNENGDYTHKEASLKNFEAFFAMAELGEVYQRGPGVASVYRAFGLQFLMLDDRYFRSHKDNKNGSTLGYDQQLWALEKLQEFAGVTWIVHGSVIFGEYDEGESWEYQFKRDLHSFMDGVKATGRKVFFASGDVHHNETQNIEEDFLGYRTLELTSSGLHTLIWPFPKSNHRRRYINKTKSFSLVRHHWTAEHIHLDIQCLGKKAKRRFRDQFSLAL